MIWQSDPLFFLFLNIRQTTVWQSLFAMQLIREGFICLKYKEVLVVGKWASYMNMHFSEEDSQLTQNMKRCLLLNRTRKIQIKTIMKCLVRLTILLVDKVVESKITSKVNCHNFTHNPKIYMAKGTLQLNYYWSWNGEIFLENMGEHTAITGVLMWRRQDYQRGEGWLKQRSERKREETIADVMLLVLQQEEGAMRQGTL